jgi:hypothetical protein
VSSFLKGDEYGTIFQSRQSTTEREGDLDKSLGFDGLLHTIDAAIKKVPAVKYAFGLAGIAACGAIVALLLGTTKTALVLLSLTFIGAVLLFIFAKLSTSSNPAIYTAGSVLVWVVVGFFTFFSVITTTAFVGAWPQPWADFLGITTGNKTEGALCNQRVSVMWTQFFNPNNQYSDALRTADLIADCAPFQFFTLKGSVAFYSGDYFRAADAFERAHELDVTDDPIKRNLGDSYVEVGRLDEALAMYASIKDKNSLWNYKVARVKFYQGFFDDALAMIEKVPSDMAEDGGLLGRPRILESAIIVARAKGQPAGLSSEMLNEARSKFRSGVELDRQSWERIFKVNARTKHESYYRQLDVLRPFISEWL